MKRASLLGVVLVAVACAKTTAPPPVPVPPPLPGLDRAALAERVRGEMRHAWRGYETYAWGKDELNPISKTAHNWHPEPVYMTAIDSLDTLIMMGFKDEAKRTQDYLAENLKFDRDMDVQVFEITIRVLGGLVTAYQMTNDPRMLTLAEDLGRRLLPAFESKTGMPYRYVNLRTGKTRDPISNPAEIGTLLLEFGTLSKLTKKPEFYDKAKRALVTVYERRSPIGLVGTNIDVETGEWKNTGSHVGGAIDSYYEYLLKCDKLFGDPDCKKMWDTSLKAMTTHLEDRVPSGLWYGSADMNTGVRTRTTFGALHAFLPAVLAMGGELGRAKELQASAFYMWQKAGIEPEVFDYKADKIVYPGYPLRPEIIESAYYLHRYTKDPRYLEMGRTMLDGLVTHCRTEVGYASLKNVETKEKEDRMPSFFLAETLKYLYVLFDEKSPGPEDVIYNTEAHPLRKTW
jgi:mannosidase alpha-like ER degradation enhancer 2